MLLGLCLPRQWFVEQELFIAAKPAAVHGWVANPSRWTAWTVWTRELDPHGRWTASGPQEGVGAAVSWLGPVAGRGQLRIIAADPQSGIELEQAIESEEPNSRASIQYVAHGDGTTVRWRDEGTLPPVVGGYFKGAHEKKLSAQLHASLGKLKVLVEQNTTPPP